VRGNLYATYEALTRLVSLADLSPQAGRGKDYDSATLTDDSGNSTPKQR
jgi:hypothetical protein